jgi:hypothetical protein
MRAIVLTALIGLAGCTDITHESGQKAIADQNKISQIQKGVTTKQNVAALSGEPERKGFEENGDETWTYTP